ncbi:MAG TPA: hypothetical protein VHP83_04900 [Aggregatilineaceae bacterium]|nr:hypothetical protein [Aggregatilineaceae bacterium]
MDGNVHLGFVVEVVQGNVLDFQADVLAVKDAAFAGGLDAQIRHRLKKTGFRQPLDQVSEGEYHLVKGEGIARSSFVLVVGTTSIYDLDYTQLRALGQRFLEALWDLNTVVKHMATTVHGVRTGRGLDEVEAFRSLLLGMSDAYVAQHYPPMLERITFVEKDEKRAHLLKDALQRFFPNELLADFQLSPSAQHVFDETTSALAAVMSGPESFEPEFRQPEADKNTPHIFVAMPFKEDYDDQFYLAIQPSVKEAGFLCERMDLDTFTGDIMERMFERIRSAKLMIALLDGSNPNVYLEVGYAWCAGTPTVLIAHKETPLPFDVRSQRVLIYDRIHKLKDMLAAELRPLVS